MKTRSFLHRCCLAAILAMSLAFMAPALSSAAMQAQAHPLDTNGTITGTLVNGTHNNAAVAGQSVTLQETILHNQAKDVMTTKSDAAGHFSFKGVDTGDGGTYAVYTHFNGGTFASVPITFDSGPTQSTTLTIYDTTPNASAISITNVTLLFSQPHVDKGLLPIGEFVTFRNSAAAAYVTSTAPANGMPMNLLRFALPSNATNLTLGAGFAGQQIQQVNTGFASSATLPPGTTQFAFAFDVPYSTTQYTYTFKAEYPAQLVNLLLPQNVQTSGHDFTTQAPVEALGQKYQSLSRNSMKHDEVASLTLRNLPQPGQPSYLDFRQLVLVVGGLSLLLLLLLALFLKRGDLVALTMPAQRSAPRGRKAAQRKSVLADAEQEAERRRLLKSLLDLDKQHSAGKVSDKDYRRERDETRATLRALLAAAYQQQPIAAEDENTQNVKNGNAVVSSSSRRPTADIGAQHASPREGAASLTGGQK